MLINTACSDKWDTAINIAFACSLLREGMELSTIQLSDTASTPSEDEEAGAAAPPDSHLFDQRQSHTSPRAAEPTSVVLDVDPQLRSVTIQLEREVARCRVWVAVSEQEKQSIRHPRTRLTTTNFLMYQQEEQPYGVIIDGESLTYALQPQLRGKLRELSCVMSASCRCIFNSHFAQQ